MKQKQVPYNSKTYMFSATKKYKRVSELNQRLRRSDTLKST